MDPQGTREASETSSKIVRRRRGKKKTRSYLRFLSHVSWALRRSRVRLDVFRFLLEMHPRGSYPAEIARGIGSTPSNVKCALSNAPWARERFNGSYSLVSLKLVEVEDVDGRRYYRASSKGLEIAKTLWDKS